MYASAVRKDLDIQQDVMRDVRWDSRFDKAQIGVSVQKGIVMLTGNVESFGKKWAASEIAHRVSDVLDVANDIQVTLMGTGKKTDAEIAKAVRHSLEWDVFVPDRKIRSTVSNSWVTLEGEVEFLRQREDAGAVIRNLAGVTGVINSITVEERHVQPAEIRKKIEEVLERRADREAERISVTVTDGAVTVDGRVRSWGEKEAVLGTVGHAPGVRKVHDKLRVEPFF
jgi:osmotically-inducible protein OsmY